MSNAVLEQIPVMRRGELDERENNFATGLQYALRFGEIEVRLLVQQVG